MNNNFEIQVLVNGNKCKQYFYKNRVYIEAKHGTEYELEIKNNTWGRILCLSSVDGLNVLSGETATDDDAGYVIPSYSPLKIKGFRYSNNEVAAFKFVDKWSSYAQAIRGAEASQHCGVIGFKLYNEITIYSPITWNIQWSTQQPCGGLYGPPRFGYTIDCGNLEFGQHMLGSCGGTSNSAGAIKATNCLNEQTYGCSADCLESAEPIRSFDMGSTWGQKVESKVIETDFKKGTLAWSLDIYYASRQALIDMGIPIKTGNQVSFPQSFPNKYATPPPNWRG